MVRTRLSIFLSALLATAVPDTGDSIEGWMLVGHAALITDRGILVFPGNTRAFPEILGFPLAWVDLSGQLY